MLTRSGSMVTGADSMLTRSVSMVKKVYGDRASLYVGQLKLDGVRGSLNGDQLYAILKEHHLAVVINNFSKNPNSSKLPSILIQGYADSSRVMPILLN